eukprot:Amastigsp_a841303_17.p2 type:complete len:258 gc:universal Amastigsp_a841303_17:456-1229(+)
MPTLRTSQCSSANSTSHGGSAAASSPASNSSCWPTRKSARSAKAFDSKSTTDATRAEPWSQTSSASPHSAQWRSDRRSTLESPESKAVRHSSAEPRAPTSARRLIPARRIPESKQSNASASLVSLSSWWLFPKTTTASPEILPERLSEMRGARPGVRCLVKTVSAPSKPSTPSRSPAMLLDASSSDIAIEFAIGSPSSDAPSAATESTLPRFAAREMGRQGSSRHGSGCMSAPALMRSQTSTVPDAPDKCAAIQSGE